MLCSQLSKVLEDGPTRTVLRVEWASDLSSLESHVVRLAVPTAAGASARILQIEIDPTAADLPLQSVPESIVELASPGRFRDQWVASARIASHRRAGERVEAIRAIEIEFSFPEGALMDASAFERERDPLLAAAGNAWVNPNAAARFARHARSLRVAKRGLPVVDSFAQGSHWLRIEIDETGIYRIGYENLLAELGPTRVNAIDPSSLRLLGARHVFQPQLPSDASGSWGFSHSLLERAIEVNASGATLAPGDEILFYVSGHEGWTDRADPTAGRLEHFEHEFADHLVYWLSWEELGESGSFPSAPLRMSHLGADPAAAFLQFSDHRERLQLEENVDDQYGLVPDNWVWEVRIAHGAPHFTPFSVDHVVPDSTATVLMGLFARRPPSGNSLPDAILHLTLNENPTPQMIEQWDISSLQENYSIAPRRASAGGLTLLEGNNVLRIDNESERDTLGENPGWPFLVLDDFQFLYRRDLQPRSGRLEWLSFPDEIAQSDRFAYEIDDASGGLGDVVLLDTSDPFTPRWLDGFAVENSATRLRFGRDLIAGEAAHFAMAKRSALLTPRALSEHTPRRIRSQVAARGMGWNMVVLHPAAFAAPAQRLVAYRRGELSGYVAPEVEAFEVQDIYDEFGHGVKEPASIRNFFKFLWEYDQSIAYACLLGDASRDYRNRLPGASSEPFAPERDQLPTWMQTQYPAPYSNDQYRAYAADDWYASMDDPRQQVSYVSYPDLPEIAMGRLPAGDPTEANELVDRILVYEQSPETGRWRNTVLMAADDEVASNNRNEGDHVEEAECISEFFLDDDFRIDKLFLTEFPSVANLRAKPSARQALKDRWSEGRLIVHYIGHGSPTQMADENVFSIEDVGDLRNGMRRPLFLAFSCDVAIFDSPTTKSMSEQLVLAPGGGAIATIAATEVTFISANEDLTEAFYPNLFPVAASRSAPVGLALMLGKQQHPRAQPPNPSTLVLHNDQRYTLFGDPAMRLQSPTQRATLSGDVATAIRSGQIQSVGADLPSGGAGLSGEYFLDLRESARFVTYFMIGGSLTPLEYRLDGESFFVGQGSFSGNQMSTQVLPPVDMRFGDHGRVELLLDTGDEFLAAVSDDHPVERAAVGVSDQIGPSIELEFEGGGTTVAPGAILSATIEDPSGINVLGTAPLNSILIELDESGFPIDVASLFQLDDGSFSRGMLAYPLPAATTEGAHKLSLSASDMLGNLTRAEIEFQVIEAGTEAIQAHLVYPNPFRDGARFVVDLTQVPQEVEISIFSTDGRPVRTLRTGGAGQQRLILPWDGRDSVGDEIANGVYLYRVRARFAGDPALSQVRMGRIVRMR